ncbi:MFS transporter [Euzebya tangerina]|uniref:MFS transporter n=1 Tax=Euzebya tangerina TaxID=591198 RepID=UPI000E3184E5|nr:MFS transporter [Euzebya tangerina]
MSQSVPLKRLFGQPLFRRWAVANLLARLPLTMNLLVLVLVGEALTGEVSTGATLAGGATFAAGATAQWRGRRLDRVELNRGLRTDLGWSSVALAALAGAAVMGAPVPVMLGLAVLLGVAFAAILGGFRALLVQAVPDDDIEAANAMDAVFVEVAFVVGPALAAILALLIPPAGLLLLMSATFLLAVPMTAGLPTREPVAGGVDPVGPAPLFTHGATPIYLLGLAAGLVLGSFESLIPARVESFGFSAESAGPFLALTALGSGIAGVVAANQSNQLRRGRLYAAALLGLLSLFFLPVAFAGQLWVLGIGMFLLGVPLAPLNALGSLALQRIVAQQRQAEGFSMYTATILIGAGSGQFLVGFLLPRSTPEALLASLVAVAGVIALAILGAAMLRRRRGLPPGLGSDHDPTVTKPSAYA